MFLVACGTGGGNGNGNGNGDDPVVTTGTLFVNVNTPATVTVLDSDGVQVDQRTNVTSTSWTVEAGDYTVQADADGFTGASESVTITAGQASTVNLTLVAETVVVGNVAKVEIVGFIDEDGNPYDFQDEVNPIKDAILVAAQTEEMVGVQVLVTDIDGAPVANAPVTVSITGDFSSALAIYAGTPVALSSQTFQGLMTDDDGMAYFVIEATNSYPTWQDILNNFGLFGGFRGGPVFEEELLPLQSMGEPGLEPIKLIVSSVGGDRVAKRAEFKAWFVNMSHLWYGEPDANFNLDPNSLIYTEVRLGADLGEIINVWDIDPNADNEHEFGTFAITKQPTSAPFAVGYDAFGYFFDGYYYDYNGVAASNGGKVGFGWGAPGYMRYVMSGDTDDVMWDASECSAGISSDGLTCYDYGSGVRLLPVSTVGLEDLPISVTIEATYIFEVPYGNELYEFELKDYTFTKTWVGGFLTIDKYVTQHVLTWPGAAVTVPAANYTVTDEYLSTVVITVENPSDTDFFNVTVRDALPAELGVVESSISNGGTYDAINHVVTWDFNDTPELQNIPAKSGLDPFTFDVYARHKPGYVWEGLGDLNFNVQPNRVAPYADPYLVTNGAAVNSVTAAGFFEDVVTGSQPVFRYVPQADESDIWVVRPIFEIVKTLDSLDVMTQGASAFYTISVEQLDRSGPIPAHPASSNLYAFLADAYPWEFGSDVIGTGHRADEYELRTNTYARNVTVSDAWEVGLDFTNGTDFAGVSAGGVINTSQAGTNKSLTWSPIADLPVGVKAQAQIVLTGNLVSDDDGAAQNGAIKQLDDGTYAWENCAYLAADQLNQPANLGGLWYPDVNSSASAWWMTELTSSTDATALVENVDGGTRQFGAAGTLEACALVAVIPVPPTPFMNISTNGEAILDGTPNAPQNEDVSPGDTFWYRFTAQNTGGATANDVVITVDRISGGVAFQNATFWRSTDGGVSWNAVGGAAFSSLSAGQVVFSATDLDAGHWLRVVIQSTATSAGPAFVDASLTYSNASTQTPPIGPVQERTDVQP